MLRKITADTLYPVSEDPIQEGVVVVDEKGVVQAIGPRSDFDEAELELHKGVLTPGFVNAHCHLELSFMKDQIPEGTGLIEFVKQVVAIRDNFTEEEQQSAIQAAADEMWKNGIQAVGDISNDTRSFAVKELSPLRFHTFVEVFDLGPAGKDQAIENGSHTYRKAPRIFGSSASITPHAPYSVSRELFDICDRHSQEDGMLLSIHNQEQKDENLLFEKHEGDWLELFKGWDLPTDWLPKSGKTSLQTYLPWVNTQNRILLVHNTHTSQEDVAFANENHPDVWWCFNPNANLYIENTLPNYSLFLDHSERCVIGTDSLASNHQLSILEEMKVIQKHAPELSFATLLQWATLNGAHLLRYQGLLGSIELGKQPGINLISNMEAATLSSTSTVKRLV